MQNESKVESKRELQLEALKLLKDWSVWLLTIEAGICTALWTTDALKGSGLAFAGWSAFCLSAMVASVLLLKLPGVVQEGNKGVEEGWMWWLARVECIFFLVGALCLIIHALLYLSPLSKCC